MTDPRTPAAASRRDVVWLDTILTALGAPPANGGVQIRGTQSWDARYPVSDLACATIGAAARMLAHWRSAARPSVVTLDRAQASRWFGYSLAPEGWALPKVRSPVTGDYRAADGWIRIHANAAHHRERALQVLGLPADAARAAVAREVERWRAESLETALVDAGACAAALRPPAAWARHPQGLAVAAEPLIHRDLAGDAPGGPVPVDPARPLAGVRVLDLTRVLAGPVATRFLAAYGAEVLRLDPPDWQEPGMVPEVTVGKRCALLDLHEKAGRRTFEQLLSRADVLVHGYRPGALAALGYDAARRSALRPGLVDVCLDAWGWTGPWRLRRGFDSLVQMSTGIAWPAAADAVPHPLPVQALDQATGYLMAACALQGLILRRDAGRASRWRLSLARTARLLTLPDAARGAPQTGTGGLDEAAALAPAGPADFSEALEQTAWGPARRLRPPCRVGALSWRWDRPAVDLRTAVPQWSSA